MPMDALIRPLRDDDRPAVARLLDDAVGAGFWRFADGAGALSFVAVSGVPAEGVAGVVISCLEPADDPDVRTALAGSAGRPSRPAGRSCTSASSPSRRRRGAPASRRGCWLAPRPRRRARGARAAFAFGWLPAGRPEPDAVPFYEAAGYVAGPDIAGLLRRGQRRQRRGVPLLRRPAVPLRGAPVRQGAGAGLRPGAACAGVTAPRCPATRCAASRPLRVVAPHEGVVLQVAQRDARAPRACS